MCYNVLSHGRRVCLVAVAQLVRAPLCGSGGCGFNSLQPPRQQRGKYKYWKQTQQMIKIIKDKISITELKDKASETFGNLEKAFVNKLIKG